MRPIGTKAHGYWDYILGVLLIAAPRLFGFSREGAETWVPVILGIVTIIYSLLTRYELGANPVIRMRTHLALDVIVGIILAVSPWLFNFSQYVWVPHLVLGIIVIGVSRLTRRDPAYIGIGGHAGHTAHTGRGHKAVM